MKKQTEPHKLPKLPYDYAALEPHIDRATMEVHHSGHHKTYVEKLNTALDSLPAFREYSIEELMLNLEKVPAEHREAIRNNGGGHFNHLMQWTLLSPGGRHEPDENLASAIDRSFGSMKAFREQFDEAATKLFGSGYVWLCVDEEHGLFLKETKNQDNPLMEGMTPIFLIDLWEHAYYLKHQNKRPDYVKAYWQVADWKEISRRFDAAISQRKQTLTLSA